MDLARLRKLIDDFKKINFEDRVVEQTFMDISGYPHYENVCSNILRFFFQTSESHGLQDLFIQALFKTIGTETKNEIMVNEVLREVVTSQGNRIDLILMADEFIIGIENKIYAGIQNDLDDYSNYLNTIKEGRDLYKIVLSINSIPYSESGFINVKYSDFFNNIDGLMGNYWQKGNHKYLIYLKDFMQTLRRIEGGNQMDDNLLNFMSENRDDIQKLLKTIYEIKNSLRQNIKDFSTRIVYNEIKCKQWFWRDSNLLLDDLVHDIYEGDAVIAIDTSIYPVGWAIDIWLRKPGKNNLKTKIELAEWLIGKGILREDILSDNQNRYVYSKRFSNAEETSTKLQEILDKLCQ